MAVREVEDAILGILSRPFPMRDMLLDPDHYIWGGYYKRQPFCMQLKTLLDILAVQSEMFTVARKKNPPRFYRTIIFNMIRESRLQVSLKTSVEIILVVEQFELAMDRTTLNQQEGMLIIIFPSESTTIAQRKMEDDAIVAELEDMCLSFAPPLSEAAVTSNDVLQKFMQAILENKCSLLRTRYPQRIEHSSIPPYCFIPPSVHFSTFEEMADRIYARLVSSKMIVAVGTGVCRSLIIIYLIESHFNH
jgi:hypothetical protein